MKTDDGELVALAAYQISGRKAYVYILYAESAPANNPVLTRKAERKYCGIGAALIAFGIKFSIDNGCRGDVVFDAKTDELAKHYAEDFGARTYPQRSERRTETVYACRRGCVAAVLKILSRGGTGTWIKRIMHNIMHNIQSTNWRCRQVATFQCLRRKMCVHRPAFRCLPAVWYPILFGFAKEKAFVEEVTRVTWAKQLEAVTGIKQNIRPAFSA